MRRIGALACMALFVFVVGIRSTNARILVGSGFVIYVVDNNGENMSPLTKGPAGGQLDVMPAWSPDGTKFAYTSVRDGMQDIYIAGKDGVDIVQLTNDLEPDDMASWAPDGTKICFTSERDGRMDIYVIGTDGRGMVRLTSALDEADPATEPAWSPDGTKIAFRSYRGEKAEIYVVDLGGKVTQVTNTTGRPSSPAWSPDGTTIAFQLLPMNNRGDREDIWTVDVVTGQMQQITRRPEGGKNPGNINPVWSRDGSKILFASDRDGNYDLYVMNADGSTVTQITHTERPMDFVFPASWYEDPLPVLPRRQLATTWGELKHP